MARIVSLPLTLALDAQQFPSAIRTSRGLNMARAYDSQYLAVAALQSAEMVTIDGGMYQNALNIGIPARLLR
jgi:hypothetical protein